MTTVSFEPLSNLDAKLGTRARTQIAALQGRLGGTTVHVTHDQVEAMTMGDRVAVLKDGVLQQCAAPRALHDEPADVFAASFIGSPTRNLEEVRIAEDGVQLGGSHLPLPRRVVTGFRPGSTSFFSAATGERLPSA